MGDRCHIRRAKPAMPVVYVSGDSAIHWGSEGVPNSIMIAKPFFLPRSSRPCRPC